MMAGWVFFFIVVVGIPVVGGILNDMHKRNVALKQRQLELMGEQTAEKAAQYAAHTERLEQRVQVLERILTDQSIDVAKQIEALREDRPH